MMAGGYWLEKGDGNVNQRGKKYTNGSRGNNSLLHGDPPKMGGFTGHSEFTMTSKTSHLGHLRMVFACVVVQYMVRAALNAED